MVVAISWMKRGVPEATLSPVYMRSDVITTFAMVEPMLCVACVTETMSRIRRGKVESWSTVATETSLHETPTRFVITLTVLCSNSSTTKVMGLIAKETTDNRLLDDCSITLIVDYNGWWCCRRRSDVFIIPSPCMCVTDD